MVLSLFSAEYSFVTCSLLLLFETENITSSLFYLSTCTVVCRVACNTQVLTYMPAAVLHFHQQHHVYHWQHASWICYLKGVLNREGRMENTL